MERNSISVMFKFSIFIWVVMSYSLPAQDMKIALSEMKEAIKVSTQMQIVMNVTVFEKEDKKSVLYEERVSVKRDNNNCLYQYSNSDFLMNDSFMVRVDKEAKEITWAHRDKLDEKTINQDIDFNIDSLLTGYGTTKFIATVAGVDHYRANPYRGDMTQVDLYFMNDTHMLSQLAYRYLNGQLVFIVFEEFNMRPQFISSVFDEANYITVKGVIAKANEKFASFSVVNIEPDKRSK